MVGHHAFSAGLRGCLVAAAIVFVTYGTAVPPARAACSNQPPIWFPSPVASEYCLGDGGEVRFTACAFDLDSAIDPDPTNCSGILQFVVEEYTQSGWGLGGFTADPIEKQDAGSYYQWCQTFSRTFSQPGVYRLRITAKDTGNPSSVYYWDGQQYVLVPCLCPEGAALDDDVTYEFTVRVGRVSITVDGLDENSEETPGAYMPEGGLVPVVITQEPLDASCPVILSAIVPPGQGGVQLWADSAKTVPLSLPYQTTDLPKTVWLEGLSGSGPRAITMSVYTGGTCCYASDSARVTVFNADLWEPSDHACYSVGPQQADVFLKAWVLGYAPGDGQSHSVVAEIDTAGNAWLSLLPLQRDGAGYLWTAVKETSASTSGDHRVRIVHRVAGKEHASPWRSIHFFKFGWPCASQDFITDSYHPSVSWTPGSVGCVNLCKDHDVRHWHRGHHGVDLDTPNDSVEPVYASERGWAASMAIAGYGDTVRIAHRYLDADHLSLETPSSLFTHATWSERAPLEGTGWVPFNFQADSHTVWTEVHHLQAEGRSDDEFVERNQQIAYENATGTAGDHVHFNVLRDGTGSASAINPHTGVDYSWTYTSSPQSVARMGALLPDWDDDDPNLNGAENEDLDQVTRVE